MIKASSSPLCSHGKKTNTLLRAVKKHEMKRFGHVTRSWQSNYFMQDEEDLGNAEFHYERTARGGHSRQNQGNVRQGEMEKVVR